MEQQKTFSKYAIELTPEQISYIKGERHLVDFERYIRCANRIVNEALMDRGFLTLGELLEELGLRITRKMELICGWVYAPEDKNHNGDNFIYIDYTVLDNGNVMLDFNVDGNILDYFKD